MKSYKKWNNLQLPNKIFSNWKRNIKSIIEKDSLFSTRKEFNNLFESILENSKNSKNEVIKIIKEALKGSGRLFVPKVLTKRKHIYHLNFKNELYWRNWRKKKKWYNKQ